MHDWPLLIYSICVQTAVGGYLTMEMIRHSILHGSDNIESNRRIVSIQFGITGILAVGIAASFLHLGAPFHSFHVLNNLSSSWLSWEILLQLIFFVGVLGMAVVQWKGWFSKILFSETLLYIKSVLIGILGLGLIYVMARLYMLETVPVWNNGYTIVSFFVTAALLGPITVLFALKPVLESNEEQFVKFFSITSRFAVVSTGFQLLFLIGLLASLPQNGTAGQASLILYTHKYLILLLLQIFLSVLLIIVLSSYGWGGGNKPLTKRRIAVILSLLYITVIIGRILFYVTFARIGL